MFNFNLKKYRKRGYGTRLNLRHVTWVDVTVTQHRSDVARISLVDRPLEKLKVGRRKTNESLRGIHRVARSFPFLAWLLFFVLLTGYFVFIRCPGTVIIIYGCVAFVLYVIDWVCQLLITNGSNLLNELCFFYKYGF